MRWPCRTRGPHGSVSTEDASKALPKVRNVCCANVYAILLEVIEGSVVSVHGERANFTGLVLECIEADFWNQVLAGKLSPR